MAIVAADALQPKAPAVAEPWRSVRAVLRLLHVCMQPVHIARKPLTNCIVRLCVCVCVCSRASGVEVLAKSHGKNPILNLGFCQTFD